MGVWITREFDILLLFYETSFSARHRDLKNTVYHSPFFFLIKITAAKHLMRED